MSGRVFRVEGERLVEVGERPIVLTDLVSRGATVVPSVGDGLVQTKRMRELLPLFWVFQGASE